MTKLAIGTEPYPEILFEGKLGEIIDVQLLEGVMLQISGSNGVLRIDITEHELDWRSYSPNQIIKEVKK